MTAALRWLGLGVALVALATLAQGAQPQGALLVLIGTALGATLGACRFGFSAAYRQLLVHRRSEGVLAQLLMLGIAAALFAPLLAGAIGNQPLAGALAPVGVQGAAGAFLFGIGMQLAGGCGSGTLLGSGRGNLRAWLALAAFCAGAFIGSLQLGLWQRLPSLPAIAIGEQLGWVNGLLLQLCVLTVVALLLSQACPPRWESGAASGVRNWLRTPRVWLLAGVLLALLNLATLLAAGHPWSITWAFSLWGAKTATLLGWDATQSAFWSAPFQRGALEASVWSDTTSVMNLALLAGVGLTGLSNRPLQAVPWRQAIAALLGGLLMGYGARLAYGCNVGAFFSGIASGSLHGWLWIIAALPGNWVGIRLRPYFRLAN